MNNPNRAFLRLCSRFNRGDLVAKRKLANNLLWGYHGYQAKAAGSQLLLECVNSGDVLAKFDICTMPELLLIESARPSDEQQIMWLADVAYGKDRSAARHLADLHSRMGNKAEALKWKRLACELGDEEVCEALRRNGDI